MNEQHPCTWTEDPYDENWWTDCGQTFEFTDGGPTDNRFRFCPYCGKRILESREVEE